MTKLRSIAVYVLALAIANYGILASASAHSHAHDGWHPAHVVAGGQTVEAHGHDHHNAAPAEISSLTDLEVNEGAPSHTETGFHSHSTPQFGPNDGILSLAFSLISARFPLPGPQGLLSFHRESPPFKPPRIFL